MSMSGDWVVKNYRVIKYWVNNRVFNPGLREDAFQTACLSLITKRALESYNPSRGPLMPYVRTCTLNSIRFEELDPDPQAQQFIDPTYSMDFKLDLLHFCRWFRAKGWREIDKPKGAYLLKTLILLMRGHTGKEVAIRTQVTSARVSQRVKELRGIWNDWKAGKRVKSFN